MGVGARPGALFARRLLSEQLERVVALGPSLRASDSVEAVHDLRVAQRRTRVLLRELSDLLRDGTGTLRRDLRWVARRTGPVRDLDTLMAAIEGRSARAGSRRRNALHEMIGVLADERARAAARLVGRLDDERHAAMIAAWYTIAGPARRNDRASGFAFERAVGPRLRRQFHRLLLVVRSIDAWSGDGEIHTARIRAKTVRYLAESLEAAHPTEQAARLIRRLKTVQDRLGAFQDLVVHCSMLERRIESGAFPDAATAGAELDALTRRKIASRPVVLQALGRIDSDRFRALVERVSGPD